MAFWNPGAGNAAPRHTTLRNKSGANNTPKRKQNSPGQGHWALGFANRPKAPVAPKRPGAGKKPGGSAPKSPPKPKHGAGHVLVSAAQAAAKKPFYWNPNYGLRLSEEYRNHSLSGADLQSRLTDMQQAWKLGKNQITNTDREAKTAMVSDLASRGALNSGMYSQNKAKIDRERNLATEQLGNEVGSGAQRELQSQQDIWATTNKDIRNALEAEAKELWKDLHPGEKAPKVQTGFYKDPKLNQWVYTNKAGATVVADKNSRPVLKLRIQDLNQALKKAKPAGRKSIQKQIKALRKQMKGLK